MHRYSDALFKTHFKLSAICFTINLHTLTTFMNIFDLFNNNYYELMHYLTFFMIQWLLGITLRLIRVYFLFKQKKLIMGRTIKK